MVWVTGDGLEKASISRPGQLLHRIDATGELPPMLYIWYSEAPPRCTKCNSPPINGQCTNHRTAYNVSLLCGFNVSVNRLTSWWNSVAVDFSRQMLNAKNRLALRRTNSQLGFR